MSNQVKVQFLVTDGASVPYRSGLSLVCIVRFVKRSSLILNHGMQIVECKSWNAIKIIDMEVKHGLYHNSTL